MQNDSVIPSNSWTLLKDANTFVFIRNWKPKLV